jgi:Pyridoxamine 5'-phosphate oxidase
MARTLPEIDERLTRWIAAREMFFVATAPRTDDGHVNVSPKGPIETLQVLAPREIAYLDYGGSGAETVAHLRENGRIVVMLCAFSGPPRIVRLHGRGEAVLDGAPGFAALAGRFPAGALGPPESVRSVIRVDVERIGESCGYGVPLMDHVGEREHYRLSAEKRLRVGGADALARRRAQHNARSIDGLPALADEPAPAPR